MNFIEEYKYNLFRRYTVIYLLEHELYEWLREFPTEIIKRRI